MKLGVAIERLQAAELDLAAELRAFAERHAAEHDIHHLAPTLAKQCDAHLERLRPFAERYGGAPAPEPDGDAPGPIDALRRRASELIGRQPTGLLLLDDLRTLFVQAQDVGVLWVILTQAAKARRDRALIDLCGECHEESIVQMHWLLTRIKETAPQALTV